MSVLIRAVDIHKKFCRNLKKSFVYGAQEIGREMIGLPPSNNLRKDEFWALKDISFEVGPGQALGLIGANGSGKTTLLRLLSGLIKPSRGNISIHGRIAPLIALGAGFNPVLSGRENVYVNLSILGLTKQRIDQVFSSVIDFAELWDSLDAPLRTYSSGMAARLGFACAIHTDPDILFVDEVLAVGDARFRMKCYQKLSELREKGVSIILVSHNSNAILSICDRALYLKKGTMVYLGPSAEAMQAYQADQEILELANENPQPISESNGLQGQSNIKISSVSFSDCSGNKINPIKCGHPVDFVIQFQSQKEINDISLNIIIRDQAADRSDLLYINSALDGINLTAKPGHNSVRIKMSAACLKAGQYICKVSLVSGPYFNVLDMVESYRFSVDGNPSIGPSRFFQPHQWTIDA